MEEEMVSGPDLGGGFLFQLTRVRDGPSATFTFHAQSGGPDANGPPIGSPEPFGWRRSEGMCAFGGRVCWHRRCITEDREVAQVRAAYNRCRFVMEAQLGQSYKGARVPWESTLEERLARVGPVLANAGAPWWLDGAAASAVRGSTVAVPAITVRTAPAGVSEAAGAIPEYLIEPAGETDWPEGRVRAARAFIGTLSEGTRVEWAAVSTGSDAIGPAEVVTWRGQSVPVGAIGPRDPR
jgi:hypothetical protein